MNKNKSQFVGHLYFGDYGEEYTLELAKSLFDNGVDILEYGIPFTDPVADGSTFRKACMRALENGATPAKYFASIRKIRDLGYKQQIVITTYYNIINNIGEKEFVEIAKESGANAILIPDLLREEQSNFKMYCNKAQIDLIQFITTNSSPARIKEIASDATGFIYLMSVAGVTGVRKDASIQIVEKIQELRKFTSVPLYVGFGISTPQQAKFYIENGADGIIIGSAIGKAYENYPEDIEKAKQEVTQFVKSIRSCIDE